MLSFINSIQLIDITPIFHNLAFDRSRVKTEDANVSFNIRTELGDSFKSNLCRLVISAEATGSQANEPDLFNLTLSVEYIFRISDAESFLAKENSIRLKLLCNYAYLDFRNRLTISLDSTGMTGFVLPYSLDKLAESV